MKKCKKCNGVFSLDLFYSGNAVCKECYKEKVKNHRKEKRDYYILYDKNRANLPHRIKAREDYAKTEKGIIAGNKAKINWSKNNLIKRSANIIVCNSVRDGKLVRPNNCESCGLNHIKIHGHHDDYNYPMTDNLAAQAPSFREGRMSMLDGCAQNVITNGIQKTAKD